MRHAGTQELETDRLFLRRLLPEDADMMYANWASDPQVTRFLRWEPHKNALETLGLLAAWAPIIQQSPGRSVSRQICWTRKEFWLCMARIWKRVLMPSRPTPLVCRGWRRREIRCGRP